MKYIFAGKKETYNKFVKKHELVNPFTIYVKSHSILKEFNCDKDVIILLSGWASKESNKSIIQKLLEKHGKQSIKCQFFDGEFGRREREKLVKEITKNKPFTRFDLLDLSESN